MSNQSLGNSGHWPGLGVLAGGQQPQSRPAAQLPSPSDSELGTSHPVASVGTSAKPLRGVQDARQSWLSICCGFEEYCDISEIKINKIKVKKKTKFICCFLYSPAVQTWKATRELCGPCVSFLY